MTSSPSASPSAGSRPLPASADEGGDGGKDGIAGTPLAGIGVLVTRPREQASRLMQDLERHGAHPILFPALAILPPRDPRVLHAVLERLDRYQWAIFISPTAAQRGLAAVRETGGWPAGLAVAAVGKGTAKALHGLGLEHVLEPDEGADSEHLLALPAMQRVTGQAVLIFRGEGGREALAETLRGRGALVSYAECYRRGLPTDADASSILELYEAGKIQAATAYSSETLDNLCQLLGDGRGGGAMLRDIPLFVPHPRIAEHARSLGFSTVVDCAESEGQLVPCLVKYFAHD